MKKIAVCLLGVVLVVSCKEKQSQVDKVIENGVEVVLNHLEPYKLRDELSHLQLEEETHIDFENEELSGLGLKEPDIVEADSKGNIYIIEKFPASDYFVYKFSPDGSFIKKFGKKGQGPGEVQGIVDLLFGKNDRLMIVDPDVNKVVEFDTEGSYLRETKLPAGLFDVLPLPNGNFLGRRFPKTKADPVGMYLSLLDPNFKEIKLIDFYDMSGFAPGKKSPGFIVHFYWRVAGDRIYVGNGSRGYEIQVWDLNGNLLRKFRKDFKPVDYPEEFVLQTEKIIAAGNKSIFIAKSMPPVNSFFIDDAGRLFAMTYEHGASQDEYIHDVFNKDGILIARVPLGNYGILGRSLNRQRAISTNGRFYRLRFKESGYPELIVYRMLWNK